MKTLILILFGCALLIGALDLASVAHWISLAAPILFGLGLIVVLLKIVDESDRRF